MLPGARMIEKRKAVAATAEVTAQFDKPMTERQLSRWFDRVIEGACQGRGHGKAHKCRYTSVGGLHALYKDDPDDPYPMCSHCLRRLEIGECHTRCQDAPY